MPHLSIEYSASLDAKVNMAGFCEAMRDAIVATGDFPLAGTRVRAFAATHSVTADGGQHDFVAMYFRIGVGRDLATRKGAVEAIYAAAESFLKGGLLIIGKIQGGKGRDALRIDISNVEPAAGVGQASQSAKGMQSVFVFDRSLPTLESKI